MSNHHKTTTSDEPIDEANLPETCPACGAAYTAIVSVSGRGMDVEYGTYCLVESIGIDAYVFHDPAVIDDE